MNIRSKIATSLFSFLCTLIIATNSWAQVQLWGATVWQYDDGSIAVQHQGQNRYYYPADQNGPPRPPSSQCSTRADEPPLSSDRYLSRSNFTVTKLLGGSNYTVDLSSFHLIKKIQLRVLSGVVKVYQAEVVNKYGSRSSLSTLTSSQQMCEGAAATFAVNSKPGDLQRLELRLDNADLRDTTAAVEVSIQYSNATCGGCNTYGCWISGAGCNTYGCWVPGGDCNTYGCSVPGGGCNTYGCWYPGGSCNTYGCQKQANSDAGEMSKAPRCE